MLFSWSVITPLLLDKAASILASGLPGFASIISLIFLITICACNASYIQTSNDLRTRTKSVKEGGGGGGGGGEG